MAYIKVDIQKMRAAADQIDQYIAQLNTKMTQMDMAVAMLGKSWRGEDYNQVKQEWNEIKAAGSTSSNMRTALDSYAASLREASQMYQEARTRAADRANSLCR